MKRWIVSRLILVVIGVCIPILGAKLLQDVLGSAAQREAPAQRTTSDDDDARARH